MRPQVISTVTLTDDANGICIDQTTGAAADLVLNGVLVTAGVATIAEAQIVAIEGTGNNAGITFTVSGTDPDNNTVSEVITGPNNSTVKSTVFFKTVTQIAASAAVTGNVEVGALEADGAVTRSMRVNVKQRDFKLGIFTDINGTLTYTVEHSADDPADTYTTSYSTDATWRATTGLTTSAVTAEGNIAFPVQAARLKINTYTSGTTKLTLLQGS